MGGDKLAFDINGGLMRNRLKAQHHARAWCGFWGEQLGLIPNIAHKLAQLELGALIVVAAWDCDLF